MSFNIILIININFDNYVISIILLYYHLLQYGVSLE